MMLRIQFLFYENFTCIQAVITSTWEYEIVSEVGLNIFYSLKKRIGHRLKTITLSWKDYLQGNPHTQSHSNMNINSIQLLKVVTKSTNGIDVIAVCQLINSCTALQTLLFVTRSISVSP